MIVRFRHKGLEKLYATGSTRGIDAQQSKRLRALLAALSTAKFPEDMNFIGTRLHPLKGDRKGYWSVQVSGNWRLIFRFIGDHATDVDLVDYH